MLAGANVEGYVNLGPSVVCMSGMDVFSGWSFYIKWRFSSMGRGGPVRAISLIGGGGGGGGGIGVGAGSGCLFLLGFVRTLLSVFWD